MAVQKKGIPVKKTFVLVHGAFFGGWVWRDVARHLRQRGHDVSAPTLNGIGERELDSLEPISLGDHVQDVVAHIEMEDLRNVTLVGWSYGGMVVTGVLDCVPERISNVIYLDAFVPEDGRSLYDYDSPQAREIIEAAMKQDRAVPPFPFDFLGVTDSEITAFAVRRQSAQPWRTMMDPVRAPKVFSTVGRSYIRCSTFQHSPFDEALARMKATTNVRTRTISEGHLCMLTAPELTVSALEEMS